MPGGVEPVVGEVDGLSGDIRTSPGTPTRTGESVLSDVIQSCRCFA